VRPHPSTLQPSLDRLIASAWASSTASALREVAVDDLEEVHGEVLRHRDAFSELLGRVLVEPLAHRVVVIEDPMFFRISSMRSSSPSASSVFSTNVFG
jgi:hypothetical protein